MYAKLLCVCTKYTTYKVVVGDAVKGRFGDNGRYRMTDYGPVWREERGPLWYRGRVGNY